MNAIAYINSLSSKASESQDVVFVQYLAERIVERIVAGRSMDCDEYRALLDLAGKPAAPFVDVAWVDDNDGRGPVKLSNSVRCF